MPNPARDVKVVLVTRNPDVAAQVEAVARETAAFTIVAMTRRADEGASLAREHRAHVIAVDVAALQDLEKEMLDLSLAAGERIVLALVPEGDWESARQALLSGARAFVGLPPRPDEWTRTLSRVLTLELLRESDDEGPEEGHARAPVLTVFSPKGGTGRTFLAANIAAAIHALTEKRVLVMEAMSLPGDLAVYFSVLPKRPLAEVARVAEDLTLANVDTLLTPYRDGLYILPGVTEYTAEPPDVDQVRVFLRVVRRLFDFVVVDTGEVQDPLTEVALKEASLVLVTMTPDLSTLYRTSKFLAAAIETNALAEENVLPVLNMEGMPGSVGKEVLSRVIGRSFTYTLPFAPEVVHEAQRRGEPVVLHARTSGVSKRIYALAGDLVGAPDDDSSQRPQALVALTQSLRSLWQSLRSGPAAQWHGLPMSVAPAGRKP